MKNEARPFREVLDEYQMIIVHHWRMITIVTLALSVTLATVVYFLPNVYQATTTIIVYPQKVPEKYVSAPVTEASDERLNMLKQEILSSTRLQEIIDRLQLYPDLKSKMGNEEIIAYMRRNIHIDVKRSGGSANSSAFTLSFDDSNPDRAALIVNRMAETFIARNLKTRLQQVEGTTQFLGLELEKARQDLQQQDDRLRSYRLQHLGEMPDQMQANIQALGQFQVQLQNNADELRRLDEKRLILNELPDADNTLRVPNEVNSRSMLQVQINSERIKLDNLRAKYTDEYPDVVTAKQQIQELQAQLASSPKSTGGAQRQQSDSIMTVRSSLMNKEHSRLIHEQEALKRKVAIYQAKVDAVPIRQEQLNEITRDYQTSKEHYNSLLEKYYAAQMATQLEQQQQAERFSVLDPAVPPDRPIRPNRPLLWFASFCVSLLAGLGIAVIRERSDPAIKSEMELLRIMPRGVEILGAVPRIEHTKRVVNQKLMRITP